MCLLFFCPSLFPLFISAFSLLFLALFSHPLPLSTSSHRLAVVLIADLSENRALIFPSPKLCPAKLTPLALTFC
jgi:hypothetical protein